MGGTRRATQRLTQREAADRLGVSVEAVRKRIRRGTLRSDLGEDGRRYVCLDAGQDAAHPETPPSPGNQELIDAKDKTIRLLQEQLEQANERDRENRRIIAALTSRIPELEPPREPPG